MCGRVKSQCSQIWLVVGCCLTLSCSFRNSSRKQSDATVLLTNQIATSQLDGLWFSGSIFRHRFLDLYVSMQGKHNVDYMVSDLGGSFVKEREIKGGKLPAQSQIWNMKGAKKKKRQEFEGCFLQTLRSILLASEMFMGKNTEHFQLSCLSLTCLIE